MNRILLHLFGTLLVTGGAAWVAITLGVPSVWVIAGSVILFGLGIMSAATGAKGSSGNTQVNVKEDNT